MMIGRTNPATPPKLTLNAAKTRRMTPYNAMMMPGVAPLALPISAAAACFRPLRSSVPVTSRMMMNSATLRFETNDSPSVVRKPSIPRLPSSAVTMAARNTMRIESSRRAKPTMTTAMPNSTRY